MRYNFEALPPLGAGLGFREPLRGPLFLNQEHVDWLEIVTDHFLDATVDTLQELDQLAAHFPLIPHGLDLSLGSAEGLDTAYADKVAALVNRLQPPWWSDHVAWTRAGGVSIGHLSPVPFTREALDVLCRNVLVMQQRTSVPLILENISYIVAMPGAEMTEAQFLTEITERTGCGLLLDVTNVYANAVNHGGDPMDFLDTLPLERVVQLHFVGGRWQNGVFVDSHSTPTPPEVWELMDTVLARAGKSRFAGTGRKSARLYRTRRRTRPGASDRTTERPMGLAAVQAALARLYTDDELRRRFLLDPHAVRAELGMTPAEAAQIETVSVGQLQFFAASLIGKRRQEVEKLLR